MKNINLQNIQFDSDFPMQIGLAGEGTLECLQLLRLLPHRRLVCLASRGAKIVIAKLFIHADKSEKDYTHELSGYNYLLQSKVLTPKLVSHGLLAQGSLAQAGYYVIYEYIANTLSLQQCLSVRADEDSITLIHKLIAIIAQMHNASIAQSDLHLNNFLLQGFLTKNSLAKKKESKSRIYTIDCGDIETLSQSASKKDFQVYKNLGCFFSQLAIIYDQFLDDFVALYEKHAVLKYPLSRALLQDQIKRWRKRRSRKYLHKISRTCSEFIYTKNWQQMRVIKRKFSSRTWLDFYHSLDEIIESSVRLKDGNTATVSLAECDGIKLVIKRYNIKNFRHYLGRFWRPSRAWYSWQNAHQLSVFGIKTPQPIAIVEKRFGWFRSQAYYVCEYEGAADALSKKFLDSGLTEIQLEDFKQLFISMFYAKMTHGDFKANNILVTDNGLSLIDLDAMKFHSSTTAFDKAYSRDLKRLIKNWPQDSKIYQQLVELINSLAKV